MVLLCRTGKAKKKTPEKVCFYFIIQQKAQHVRRAAVYFFKQQKLINFDASEKYCNTVEFA